MVVVVDKRMYVEASAGCSKTLSVFPHYCLFLTVKHTLSRVKRYPHYRRIPANMQACKYLSKLANDQKRSCPYHPQTSAHQKAPNVRRNEAQTLLNRNWELDSLRQHRRYFSAQFAKMRPCTFLPILQRGILAYLPPTPICSGAYSSMGCNVK